MAKFDMKRVDEFFGSMTEERREVTFAEIEENCGPIPPAYIDGKGFSGPFAFRKHLVRIGYRIESVNYENRTLTVVSMNGATLLSYDPTIPDALTRDQQLIYKKCITDLSSLESARLSDEFYYDGLPQCIIDAVFSIGTRYVATRKTVIRYCDKFGIKRISSPLGSPSDTHTVNDLLENLDTFYVAAHSDWEKCAHNLFGNRQKLSKKRKAEVVCLVATALKNHEIQTIADLRRVTVAAGAQMAALEQDINAIPGLKSGIVFSYLLMLAGDDNHMKIDRWLLRFVGKALGNKNFSNAPKAYSDLLAVCEELKKIYPNLTPRLLDHTIWNYIKSQGK